MSESLEAVQEGGDSEGLSRGQRYVMHEILSTLQNHLDEWNNPSNEG